MVHPKSLSSRQQWATPPGTSRYNWTLFLLWIKNKKKNNLQTFSALNAPLFAWENNAHSSRTLSPSRKATKQQTTAKMKTNKTHTQQIEEQKHKRSESNQPCVNLSIFANNKKTSTESRSKIQLKLQIKYNTKQTTNSNNSERNLLSKTKQKKTPS